MLKILNPHSSILVSNYHLISIDFINSMKSQEYKLLRTLEPILSSLIKQYRKHSLIVTVILYPGPDNF